MEFEVEVTKGGIKFLVSGYCDSDGSIDMIDKVCVYQGKQCFEVDFEQDDFIREFEDCLLEAIDESKRDEAIWQAEMRMDAKKEEGWN